MNIPADFSLNVADFQLRDFSETLSFKSYSLLTHFAIPSQPFCTYTNNAMRILGCTSSAKYSLFDLAKNSYIA